MVNLTASQVKLTYVNEVPKKERIKITGPESVYNLLLQEVYDKETIEHHMSVKLILSIVRCICWAFTLSRWRHTRKHTRYQNDISGSFIVQFIRFHPCP